VFDISRGSLFYWWSRERRRVSYRFHYFQKRRRVDYQFRPSCAKRMRHRSHRKRFSDSDYQMASVFVKCRMRVLIILMNIHLR